MSPDLTNFDAIWKRIVYVLADGFAQLHIRAQALARDDENDCAIITLHSSKQTVGSQASGRGSGVVCNEAGLVYVKYAICVMHDECLRLFAQQHPDHVSLGGGMPSFDAWKKLHTSTASPSTASAPATPELARPAAMQAEATALDIAV